MKQSAVWFWVILSFLPIKVVSQTNKIFYSLEETKNVSVDSVFRIDLSKQKLTKVPDEVLRFKNLKELHLNKNKLTALPKRLVNLKYLSILNLSKNDFSVFPSPLCSMENLTILNLSKNDIEVIPDCIGQLKNIEILDLYLNPLSGLPNSISELKKLKVLDLRGINFSTKTQVYIQNLIPWAKVEFNTGCDCGN